MQAFFRTFARYLLPILFPLYLAFVKETTAVGNNDGDGTSYLINLSATVETIFLKKIIVWLQTKKIQKKYLPTNLSTTYYCLQRIVQSKKYHALASRISRKVQLYKSINTVLVILVGCSEASWVSQFSWTALFSSSQVSTKSWDAHHASYKAQPCTVVQLKYPRCQASFDSYHQGLNGTGKRRICSFPEFHQTSLFNWCFLNSHQYSALLW